VNDIRVCELFAGIGGFRYGLENASSRFRTVYANEFNKHAAAIYRHHYPDGTLQEADVHTVQTARLPDFDLLVAGFPCQPFSIAGQRQGTNDPRGTLYLEILRITKAKWPKILLLENVPGLLSIEQGRVFKEILYSLHELGYTVEWRILDSQYFGVPQQRRRVFIIAYLTELARGRGTVFPNRESDSVSVKTINNVKNVSTTLTSSYGAKQNIGGNTFLIQPRPTSKETDQVRVYTNKAPTLQARMGTGGGNVPYTMILGNHTKGNIKQREKNAEKNPSWTLGGCQTLVAQALQTDGYLRNGSSWGTNKSQSERNIRRLTPIECERLQGFKDNYTKHGLTQTGQQIEISNTQRYKTLGNAVTTNVITALGELILQFIDKEAS